MATEEEIIALIREMTGEESDTLVGIGDDAAVLQTGERTLATADLFIEGVHFKREYASWTRIGRKAVTVNLSDIAAMGGEPKWALLSLALPRNFDFSDTKELIRGMVDQGDCFGVKIVGGDLSAAEKVVINLTLLGIAPPSPLLRSGAQSGDNIWVTGTLGDSAAGLEAMKLKFNAPFLIERHLNPTPRLKEGQILSKKGLARSLTDISDGLGSDLNRLCRESKVGAQIHSNLLPISEPLLTHAHNLGRSAADFALYGGEDYELLFSATPDLSEDILADFNIPVTNIGNIVPLAKGVRLLHPNKKPEPLGWGFDHFIS